MERLLHLTGVLYSWMRVPTQELDKVRAGLSNEAGKLASDLEAANIAKADLQRQVTKLQSDLSALSEVRARFPSYASLSAVLQSRFLFPDSRS